MVAINYPYGYTEFIEYFNQPHGDIMNIISADEALFKTVENQFPEHLNEVAIEISKAISEGKLHVYIDEFDSSLTSKSLAMHMGENDDGAIDMITRYLTQKGYHVELFTGTVTGCKQSDTSRSWILIGWL